MPSVQLIDQMAMIDLLDQLSDLSSHLGTIISNAIAFLLGICFIIGVVLAIVGAIQWATGWDNREGKKTVVKGLVLVAFSIIGSSIGLGISMLT
jgi:hypothetical protein